MIEMNLQLFGGRGSSSGGGGGGASGGLDPADIVSTTSLISASGKAREIGETLNVLRDVYQDYGLDVTDAQIATLKGKGQSAMAYYDSAGNLAINENYFSSKRMDAAYDKCGDFHPSRGNKTGIEAVTAHEMGHRISEEVGVKMGLGNWQLDKASNDIVRKAAKASGYKGTKDFRAKISGYSKQSNAEAVAEAFADVYCNGSKAKKESRAVVNVINTYFGR